MSLTLGSTVFRDGQPIPTKYTCDGDNVSMPLQWADPPEGTRSFAIIVDDPSAPSGAFVHWIIFNLPPDARDLPEGAGTGEGLPAGALNGNNSARQPGYTAPCPPSGVHHYVFRLYALDAMLPLREGASRDQLLRAMQGHILAEAELRGDYGR